MIKRTDTPFDIDTSHMNAFERANGGYWYIYRNHPELKVSIHKTIGALNEIAEIHKENPLAAKEQLCALIPGIHPTADISFPFVIEYANQFEIGEKSFINHSFYVCSSGKVTIGKNCFIGPNCNIYTPNHHPNDLKLRRAGWQYDAAVTIGDDVWFGGSVTVCPGVSIGNNVVVGAGSVVTKDIPDNSMVGGNPAKIIKTLENNSTNSD